MIDVHVEAPFKSTCFHFSVGSRIAWLISWSRKIQSVLFLLHTEKANVGAKREAEIVGIAGQVSLRHGSYSLNFEHTFI